MTSKLASPGIYQLVKQVGRKWGVPTAALISLILTFAQSLRYFPVVFGDEYIYNFSSRLDSFSNATRPNYLYFLLFGTSSFCGEAFLSCVKFLNVLCYGIGAFFVYKTSRIFLDRFLGSIILLLTIIWPTNRYSIYFMPESMYFMGFWIFVYLLFRVRNHKVVGWFFLGSVLGLLSLIKPHAVFLLPAALIVVSHNGWISKEISKERLSRAISAPGLFMISFLLVKFGVGFLLAGPSGLTFFGETYGSILSKNISMGFFTELLDSFYFVSKGHMLSLIFLFSLPLIVLFAMVLGPKRFKDFERNKEISPFYLFTMLALSTSVIFVTLFTMSVAEEGTAENLMRLHQRYYNFLFPLLFIVLGSAIYKSINFSFKFRVVITFIGLIFLLYSGSLLAKYPNTSAWIDSPEYSGTSFNPNIRNLLVILMMVAFLLWAFYPKLGYQFFLIACLFSVGFAGNTSVDENLKAHINPDKYTQAGLLTRDYLNYFSPKALEGVAVFGSDMNGLKRTLFQIDSAKAVSYLVGENDPINLDTLPVDREWIVVFGTQPIKGATSDVIRLPEFGLLHRAVPINFSFEEGASNTVPLQMQGLGQAESWGTWSVSKTVELGFTEALPKYLSLEITAQAFGPNVGQRVLVSLGEQTESIEFVGEVATRKIDFVNTANSDKLTIVIPKPTSPNSITDSPDLRNLGIGFHSIKIIPHEK